MSKTVLTLTKAEVSQLLAYANAAEEEGWFYGHRLQFEIRHQNIMVELHKVLRSKYE